MKAMPAKATLFNGKCEALFDFGTGPRNEVNFSPHGNNILFFLIKNIQNSFIYFLTVSVFTCLLGRLWKFERPHGNLEFEHGK